MYNAATTDNQNEIYDVVTQDDVVIGRATRKEVHSNPKLIHRAAGAYIFNSKKQLLMQKRSKTKDMFPLYWAFSVGGHVDSGDTYEATVAREIWEELGEQIPVVPVEKVLNLEPEESEYWMVFMGIHDGPFPNFNTVEAEEVRFFDIDTLIKAAKEGTMSIPPNVVRLFPKVKILIDSGKVDELIHRTS